MFKHAWEQEVYNFQCMRGGKTMKWLLDDKGVHLFIDDREIDLEAEV